MRKETAKLSESNGALHRRSDQEERSLSASRLRFCLLGGFEILQDGLPLPRTRTRTEQWLLTLLLLRSHQEIERSWLADTFWPDSEEARALSNLRRSLSNLRQVLGDEAYRIHSPTRSTITFDLSNASCDLYEFDAAVERGDSASLERAIALYGGPLVPGCDTDWIVPDREARASAYATALETLAHSAFQQGKHPEAVHLLRQLLHRDPYQEAAVCALMQSLAACGDRAGMLLAYRQFRLLLHEELQAEPLPQTKELYERLREETARGKGAKLGAGDVSASSSLQAPQIRLNVPLLVSEMVGREEEIAEIIALLANARLITLAGTGGIGKTRLALAVAARMAKEIPDGVWFVQQSIASALQLPPAEQEDLSQEIAKLRQAMGDPSFTPAWSNARAANPDQTIHLALNSSSLLKAD